MAAETRPDFSSLPAYVEPPRPPSPRREKAGLGPFVVVGGIAAVTAVCFWLNVAPSRPAVFAPAQPQPEVFSRPDPPPVARPPMVQDVPLPSALQPPPAVHARHVAPSHKPRPNSRG